MKKFLALVLALLMALSCVSFAGAEETKPGSETYNCEKDGHVMGDFVANVSDASCTAKKVETHVCTKCGEKVNFEVGEVLAHEAAADDEVTYVDSTCTAAGYWQHTKCKNCGLPYTVVDNEHLAKSHDFKNVKEVKPTCTEDGYFEQKCSRCDATQTVKNGDKLGHLWSNDPSLELDESQVMKDYHKDPTCLTFGYDGSAPYCVREGCTAVNEKESTLKQLPKLTHASDEAAQADLVAMFFTYFTKEDGTVVCVGSPMEEGQNTVTKAAHKLPYGDLTYEYKAATCEEDGFVTVSCECGWTKTEVIAKYDHTYVTGDEGGMIVAVPEDERVPGKNAIYVLSVKYLDKTGKVAAVYDMMPPMGAAEFKPDHYKDLYDCTLEMVAHYQCDICGKEWDGETFCFTEHKYEKVYSYTQTDVQGHTHTYYVVGEGEDPETYPEGVNPKDCMSQEEAYEKLQLCQDYTVTYQCVRCQQKTTKTVKGEGHDDYLEFITNYKKDTCTVPGSDFYECTECGISVIVNHTTLAPHDEELVELVNNTCTTDGKRVLKCKVCGATRTEVIPATGHEEYLAKTVEATCEKTGLKTYKCARCGEVTRTVELPRAHVVASMDDVKVNENCTYSFVYDVFDKDGKKIGYKMDYTWDDCTKNGKLQFICVHCNLQTITYTGKADHNWVLKNTTKETPWYTFEDDNTCVVHYYEYYECKDCKVGKEDKNLKKVEVTEKVTHATTDVGERVIKFAKCGEAGEALRFCVHCEEWVKEVIPAQPHRFETTWDAKNEKWTYTCADCGHVEDVVFNAPRFVIDASKINWANKTTGKGYVELEDNTMPFIQPRVYIRWTWVTKDGCDVVADKVVDVRTDDEGNHYFDAKGFAVSGASLSEMLIIVTDDENPDEMSISAINKLGYTVVKK